MSNPNLVKNIASIAVIDSLVKLAVKKLGLEQIAPLDPAIQDEKVSKAINHTLKNLKG